MTKLKKYKVAQLVLAFLILLSTFTIIPLGGWSVLLIGSLFLALAAVRTMTWLESADD